MGRKVLLIEPNYHNKYPPMGLMKIATYFRNKGDDIRFFKGDLTLLASELIAEYFYTTSYRSDIRIHFPKVQEFIKTGKSSSLEGIPYLTDNEDRTLLEQLRKSFVNGLYPQFDIVCVTTLFTFYWAETIATINKVKKFCDTKNLYVGGIAATILHDKIFNETGIKTTKGLLDKPGTFDKDDTTIIDNLPLDYSILEEIDYKYPDNNAYFAYTTRGCVRKCKFCVVPKLEPIFDCCKNITTNIKLAESRFGPRRDLLLLDNNVLAADNFDDIIDQIKDAGFAKGATYVPTDEYSIVIKNIKDLYNANAYAKKAVDLYDTIAPKLKTERDRALFFLEREKLGLLYKHTATPKAVIDFDNIAAQIFHHHAKKTRPLARHVDFNQGLDARLLTEDKIAKLSEICIWPLRLAFDSYKLKDEYANAVALAAKYDIRHLSNYMLYNFTDKPIDLYKRLRFTIDLCEQYNVSIYSFPMKYHPIEDPKFFSNRDYIGKYWSRKFIRSIQAIMNATMGKIGRGKDFFEAAFGKDEAEFERLLWMPEKMIIYRSKYQNSLALEWWNKFKALKGSNKEIAHKIIMSNDFNPVTITNLNTQTYEVLSYYLDKK